MKYAAVLNVFGPGWLFLDPDCNQLNSSYLVTIDFFFFFFYLQLFFVKGFEQVLRNNLIKAFLQGQKLSLNAMQETPVYIQPTGETWAWKYNRVTNSHTLGSSWWSYAPLHTWHTPSWCPPTLKLSCHLVWAHVGWFLRKHCARHRKYDPGHQWCRCPWRGGVETGKIALTSVLCFNVPTVLVCLCTYNLGFVFY